VKSCAWPATNAASKAFYFFIVLPNFDILPKFLKKLESFRIQALELTPGERVEFVAMGW
jgi:hypothetical protein